MEDIEGVLGVVRGRGAGKRVVIVGGTHGDEQCGIETVQEAFQDVRLSRGEAVFVMGNPRAIERNVRFTEANLNRMFRPEEELSEEKKVSYEFRRSRELMPLFTLADALLDVHTSESEIAPPFVICCPTSRETAAKMPFPILSYGWDKVERGGTDDFMERAGKIGVGLECGYDKNPDSRKRARVAIRAFLFELGLIDEAPENKETPVRTIEAVYAHMPKVDFKRAQAFPDFMPVKKGELIGVDGTEEIRAREDGCVIFVRNRIGTGQEAYIFALER